MVAEPSHVKWLRDWEHHWSVGRSEDTGHEGHQVERHQGTSEECGDGTQTEERVNNRNRRCPIIATTMRTIVIDSMHLPLRYIRFTQVFSLVDFKETWAYCSVWWIEAIGMSILICQLHNKPGLSCAKVRANKNKWQLRWVTYFYSKNCKFPNNSWCSSTCLIESVKILWAQLRVSG